ncbi:MAG: aldo/keto reductase [Bacteroidales bacterium]|jgi:aryl-alcohol dehydrogenase-like predicted oxidoreductase
MKLVLGTVQFGTDYGINNVSGKVSLEEVESILRLADSSGIGMLDTSFSYGDSEIVLGKFTNRDYFNFNIVSKFPQNKGSVEDIFSQSLQRLNCDKLYGYLIHHFDYYRQNPEIWDSLRELKDLGKVKKIGFSLYTVEELDFLLDRKIQFDIIQVPYNIFDRQFESYFKELRQNGIEIHTRSVFMQGLFFKPIETLTGKLLTLKPYLKTLNAHCEYGPFTVEQLALGYVTGNPYVDGVLIGVDNVAQLKRNIENLKANITENEIEFIRSIVIKEKEMLNPTNWK